MKTWHWILIAIGGAALATITTWILVARASDKKAEDEIDEAFRRINKAAGFEITGPAEIGECFVRNTSGGLTEAPCGDKPFGTVLNE